MSDRPVLKTEEIEVTPEMVMAGAEEICRLVPDDLFVCPDSSALCLADAVYRAMVRSRDGTAEAEERCEEVLWRMSRGGEPIRHAS